jgi:hypothetical protein
MRKVIAFFRDLYGVWLEATAWMYLTPEQLMARIQERSHNSITQQLMELVEKDGIQEIHCSQNVIDAVCLETNGEVSSPLKLTCVSIYGAVLIPTNTLRPGTLRVYKERGVMRGLKTPTVQSNKESS